ncbi:MAG: hypothetical protein IIY21_00060 [Clostridiales bacterium]|nr:hypothetical protein [Clostridiales bacterium]MBQ1570936.1 hypothetical protein [Clostridiales bacterium]
MEMTRKEELMEEVKNDLMLEPLINNLIYLEKELEHLIVLPKIKVDQTDPQRQKATPASKLYKEYLQQYINALKVVIRSAGIDQVEDDSPLVKWMNEHIKK